MQPHVLQSLRRATEIPCMIICSGTSRLVVIDACHLPQSDQARQALLLDLMLGKPHGLGGNTSQANKIALVTSDRSCDAFSFHFYQILHTTGRMLDNMECSNAAAAAGLFARLSGVARPRPGQHLLRTTNTATGQRVLLTIPGQDEIWKSPWGVRFELEKDVSERFQGCAEPHRIDQVPCHLVPHGNLFAFFQFPPERMTSERAEQLAQKVTSLAIELGRARPGFVPKIIPYEVRGPARVAAASFFHGEKHASLPGSAAMALGVFLTLAGAVSASPLTFDHQGGSIEVTVNLPELYAEFATPVRLLLHGAAPVPPEHSFTLEENA